MFFPSFDSAEKEPVRFFDFAPKWNQATGQAQSQGPDRQKYGLADFPV